MADPQHHVPAPKRLVAPRVIAFIMAAFLLIYLVILGERAMIMIISGRPVFIALGLAILVLPVLTGILLFDQLRFGTQMERLARRLEAEGVLPDVSHLPRRPSGRVERDAADEWFDRKQAEVEAAPEDWRAWFALGQAYDLAGDRNRGRKAMRHAIELERGDS